MNYKHIKYIAIAAACFIFFGGIPVEFGSEGTFFHGYQIPKPVISIGIGMNLKEIKITASSGMKIYEAGSVYNLLADDTGEALVKSNSAKITEKFVIILATTNNRKEAERRAAGLKDRVAGRVFIEEQSESGAGGGVFLVKLGDFITRSQALEKVAELNRLGYADAWIERDIVPESGFEPYWILTEGRLLTLPVGSEVYFVPSAQKSLLASDGHPYRGIFILKNTRHGFTLVNVVNLEDYLRSVVPGELSPSEFPAIEALKAQAVAARTYALKNMGQFQESGFDLVYTPLSQVYLGVSAEHALSDRAVDETRGEVILYHGDLINALYSSTCGGKTENAENVFQGPSVPYLRSVECSYEKQPEYYVRTEGRAVPVIVGDYDVSLETAQAVGLGIIEHGVEPFDLKAPVQAAELAEWVGNTQRLVGFKAGAPEGAPAGQEELDYLKFARQMVESFGWQERISQLVLPSEVQFISKAWPSQTDAAARKALAYCLQAGFLPAFDRSDASAPSKSVTRAEAAAALVKVAFSQKDFFQTGLIRAAGRDSIEVTGEGGPRTIALSKQVSLVNDQDGNTAFSSQLTLLGGEKVRWIEREDKIELLEVMRPAASNTLDRFSRLNRWQVVRTREEMEKRLNQFYQIGKLKDLVVRRRGASGRVTELIVTGSDRTMSLKGIQVRNILNLRDSLFVIDKSYVESGEIGRFTFSGRGWGHGVGLCQVGAYGMAVAGADYKDILKKYYKGVKIEKKA